MAINDFVTLDFIASFAGTVVVTMLVVQFLKELPFIKNIPTRYFVFVAAFANIVISQITNEKFLLSNIYLVSINAILTTFAATGGYDFAVKSVNFRSDATEQQQKKIGF